MKTNDKATIAKLAYIAEAVNFIAELKDERKYIAAVSGRDAKAAAKLNNALRNAWKLPALARRQAN